MYKYAREESCPIVYQVGKPQLGTHPFLHTIFFANGVTTNSILKSIIVNLVNYFIEVMQFFAVVGIFMRHAF